MKYAAWIIGAVASAAAGQNQVLELNGFGEHAAIPHSASQDTTNAITIEYWAHVEQYSGRPVHKRSGSNGQFDTSASNPLCGGPGWGWTLFSVATGTDYGCMALPPAQLPTGTFGAWNHYAVSWSASSQRVRSYVNGVLVQEQNVPSTAMRQSTDPLCFGDIGAWSDQDFRGRLDNIRAWGIERTQAEIAANATRVLAASEAATLLGLIGSWSFDDGAVTDARGQNSGVLVGGASILEDEEVYATADCNADGVLDAYQIVSGQYADADSDGLLDICECVGPSVSSQPVATVACSSSSASFMITASGTSPSFQWRKNEADIEGAISATYTIHNVTPTDAGSYDCVVTNACGTATSTSATLTVRTPQVLTQPVSQTVNVDQPVFFALETDPQPPCHAGLAYRWQRRNPLVEDDGAPNAWLDLSDGGGLSGTHTPNLAIFRPTPGLATGYRCKLTNACGCEADENGVIYTATVNFAAACPSDFNNDGSVDGDDVIEFFERWDNGC